MTMFAIYFGHGDGELENVWSYRIRSLSSCAATILWGQSYASNRDARDLNRQGWDITICLLNDVRTQTWIGEGLDASYQERGGTELSPHSFCINAIARLPNRTLTAAAILSSSEFLCPLFVSAFEIIEPSNDRNAQGDIVIITLGDIAVL
ncbi:hypothetical protein CPC08DRAFT_731434 [Agrocybe pediades]|nr:hypothetical protein CPC08DRAFT_731434 [Agrocybe pediades]